MSNHRAWIIIRNGQDMRLVKQRPSLSPNEVAVEVMINAPDPPRIVAKIEVTLPDPPPAYAEAEIVEYEPDEKATQ